MAVTGAGYHGRDNKRPGVVVDHCNILIVSDRQTDRLVLASCLERAEPARFNVTVVENLPRPLDALTNPRIHVLIVAYGEDTDYLLRLARKNDAATPILVLVEDIDTALLTRLRELGAQDYLVRGQLQDELVHRIMDFAVQLRLAREQIIQLTNRDTLTGALNRQGFRAHLERAMTRSDRYQFKTALLLVNIDRFSEINEHHGESGGDAVIRICSERLKGKLRRTDSLSRLGGDEFVVVLEDVGAGSDVDAIADKMLRAIHTPMSVEGKQLVVEVSMGATIYPDHAVSYNQLVEIARRAMLAAKRNTEFGQHYLRYTPDLPASNNNGMSLEEELRAAVHRNEFLLYFQPRIDLTKHKIVGLEALLRWQHPQKGVLLPASFLPECERLGLIRHIGYQVITHACAAINWLDEQHMSDIDVAVNVSFDQCQDERFADTVTEIVRRAGVDASRLELELTESTILKSAGSLKERMDNLRGLGISFSLDDFGTGFSQLSHIMDLPISALKIDACFVEELPGNKQQEAVCTMIIDMARRLELRVIAEGAETQEQIDFLVKHNCEQVQGLYYSAAIPLENLPRVIHDLRARPAGGLAG